MRWRIHHGHAESKIQHVDPKWRIQHVDPQWRIQHVAAPEMNAMKMIQNLAGLYSSSDPSSLPFSSSTLPFCSSWFFQVSSFLRFLFFS